MRGSSGSHYSCAFNIDKMQRDCIKIGGLLKQFTVDKKCDIVFIYSGMSGVATATSLSHILRFKFGLLPHMVYVRKRNEISHGDNYVEYSYIFRR